MGIRHWVAATGAAAILSCAPTWAQTQQGGQGHQQGGGQQQGQGDMNAQAQQLCTIGIGALAFGQYPVQQVLGQQALQTAQQQTGGTGVYKQIQQLGQLQQVQVINPHFDQDQQFGQLFHFYCMGVQQQGTLQWEFKFAPTTGKIEYFAMAPANQQQQPQQPQFPQQPQPQQPQFPQQPQPQQPQFPQQPQPQQPQFPQQPQPQQPQFPQQQPQQQPGQQSNPSRDEACKMFPGMC